MNRRVVITGMGVISPLGTGLEKFASGIFSGQSGVDRITLFKDLDQFPTKIAAEVKDFNPEDYMDKKDARRNDRYIRFAVGASKMAVQQAGLKIESEDPSRVGVIIGSGIGGLITFQEQHKILLERGVSRVSPFFIPMLIPDMAAGVVSMELKAQGPNYATVSACSSGAHAIGVSLKTIRNGEAEVMIAGGAEATVCEVGIAGFTACKALSTRNENPTKASSPFDKKRDGFVMGEGAGILILEEMNHALKRGATIYAELSGAGFTGDAHHLTAPAPNGAGAARAMQEALRDAGIAPAAVDYINAHGTSTQLNDKFESMAIKTVFGEHASKLKISSTKSMIGHLLGASGAVELIACVLSIQQSKIHPTINYEDADPECDLNYVPNRTLQQTVNTILSNSLGFGGHNVSLIVKKYHDGK